MSEIKTTYKTSGVDIQKADAMVESMKQLVNKTHGTEVLAPLGGFGGYFQPDLRNYNNPVLVSSTDGVGTKVLVSLKAGVYDTIGQDLVNHCVNDIAVCGADPLFFLDYISTGALDTSIGMQLVKGIAAACKENSVALIGGETAEMPDVYSNGKFDIAGTITGVVDRDQIVDGSGIKKGDLLLGFKSSGLHTNGYSLARKVLFPKYDIHDSVPELGSTLGEELLSIHTSYLPVIKKLRKHPGLHGFSHITGGGILGNTRRIIPEGSSLKMEWNAWKRPPIFDLIQKTGSVPEADMLRSFNLGIGLIAIIDASAKDEISEAAAEQGESAILLGSVV
jgi:phosphoribosylformylglycinamidine cyclo-ligase